MMGQATIGRELVCSSSGPPSTLRRWIALAAGLVLIWLFVFVIAPALQRSDMVRPLATYVRESGIDASALYYTEVSETGEAEMSIRDALAYGPKGP